jgi:oligoribonuclease NrnB/cAMP/cGMP phosphodiesterase (DHH superfamily)
MPYVIHHNDHDGKCSAAIVMNELLPVFVKDQIVCIEYNYGYNVNWDEVLNPENFLPNGKEICYIVDVALNDTIFNVIKMLVEHNVKVVHIDHHQGTLDYLGKDGVSDILSSENVIQFYRMDISATMLCWVYSCMTEEERQRPMEIEFDFTPTYSHVMINLNDKGKAREYRINPGVFYIDDYDIWRHSSPTTMEFHYGLMTVLDTNPKLDKLWGDILYGNERVLKPFIDKGSAIFEYKKMEYERILKRGKSITIHTPKDVFPSGTALGFIVNNPCDSFMFESIKKDYDVCIAYWCDDKNNKWRYSFRSSDTSMFDCNKFAQLFGGSGHELSSGCVSTTMLEFE